MTNKVQETLKSNAKRLMDLQIMSLSFVVFAVACFAPTWQTSYSVFLGGFVCILTTYLFARLMFSVSDARALKQVLSAFYRAEVLKIVAVTLFFFVAIKFLNVNFLPFLTAYIGVQLTTWFAPWVMKSPTKGTNTAQWEQA